MNDLTICTWIWGDRYGDEYVRNLFKGIDRHLDRAYRKICFTDRPRVLWNEIEQRPIPNPELIGQQSECCVRLRLFDPELQSALGLRGRVVTFDLDCVIVGDLDVLFDRPEPFVITQEVNVNKPCPYNGSLQMFRTGTHGEVWSSWEAARNDGRTEWSDENWLATMIPNAASWTGRKDGVWSMHKMHWPGGLNGFDLPDNARVVFFTGKLRKPMTQFAHLPWFAENWK